MSRYGRFIRGFVGTVALFGLYFVMRLGTGCNASQQATLKKVENSAIVQCAVPQAAEVAMCIEQGGPKDWCALRAAAPYLECLWQKHLQGNCESNCPFHQGSDGGAE